MTRPILFLIALLSSFTSMALAQGQAKAVAADFAPGKFIDVTDKSGIQFKHMGVHTSRKYLIETMGSGVALLDYDNDGLLDIFLVNVAPISDPTPKGTIPKKTGPEYWDRLYHQKKDGTFEDVTMKAGLQGVGYGMGVAVGDFDNDGFEDIYVTNAVGGNVLYHNQGNGTFKDVTAASGTRGAGGWSSSAAWADLDNDGLLDLIVLRYMKWDFDDIWCGERKDGARGYCHPDVFAPEPPLVFHNDGNGKFTEVGQKIGIDKPGKGLGLSIADYDRDGHIDVLVANDAMVEHLYHNKGDGTFEEVGLLSEIAVDGDGRTYSGMGTDFADYKNYGWPDIAITNLANQKYALYDNNRDGTFTYATYTSGLGGMTLLHSGWGIKFMDYDNDGLKDLLIVQGHDMDNIELNFPQLRYKEPIMLARNTGQGFVPGGFGGVFEEAWVGRGLAVGDLDNDGRLDAIVTTNGGAAHVLHNEAAIKNRWLLLNLVGQKSNRDAIGAVVKLTTSQGSQYATVSTTSSYESANDKRVHFGMGSETTAQSIEVHWTSGIVQTLKDIRADQVFKIDEPLDEPAKTVGK